MVQPRVDIETLLNSLRHFPAEPVQTSTHVSSRPASYLPDPVAHRSPADVRAQYDHNIRMAGAYYCRTNELAYGQRSDRTKVVVPSQPRCPDYNRLPRQAQRPSQAAQVGQATTSEALPYWVHYPAVYEHMTTASERSASRASNWIARLSQQSRPRQVRPQATATAHRSAPTVTAHAATETDPPAPSRLPPKSERERVVAQYAADVEVKAGLGKQFPDGSPTRTYPGVPMTNSYA